MAEHQSDYASFIEHPRFGRGPRVTGFDPQEEPEKGILFGIFPPESRIPNTAILANIDLQKITSFPIPYYFDQAKVCRDCNRPFIFFAEEQRYWFEELQFNLNADCVRCFPCREQHRQKKNRFKGASSPDQSHANG